ncbi:MAG: hypothetical protein ACFCVD_06190 [Nodosilinea sp.]
MSHLTRDGIPEPATATPLALGQENRPSGSLLGLGIYEDRIYLLCCHVLIFVWGYPPAP